MVTRFLKESSDRGHGFGEDYLDMPKRLQHRGTIENTGEPCLMVSTGEWRSGGRRITSYVRIDKFDWCQYSRTKDNRFWVETEDIPRYYTHCPICGEPFETELSESKDEWLEKACDLIDDYLYYEFNQEESCREGNLSDIGLMYTTGDEVDGEYIELQVSADLKNCKLNYYGNGNLIYEEQYDSLEDMINSALYNLNFDDLYSDCLRYAEKDLDKVFK